MFDRPSDQRTARRTKQSVQLHTFDYILRIEKKKVVKRHNRVKKRRSQSLKVGKEKKSEDRQIENE